MTKPKVVVGHLINDEMLVKAVTTPEHLEWLKWLDPEELTAFFEELLKLVTQIAQEKEHSETLTIFLDEWRANAAINSELYGFKNITETVPEVADALGIDMTEAAEELNTLGIDIVEAQWEQELTASNTYTEPEPVVDITEEQRDAYFTLSIFEIPFSVRIHNCLKSRNIETVRDLVRKTEKELLLYKGLGRGSMREIKEKLAVKGLWLGMDLDDEDYEEDEDIYEEDTE